MHHAKNRRNNRRSRNSQLNVENAQLSVLNRLYEVEKTQVRGLVERVPDPPRMLLKREKVYTFARLTLTNNQLVNSAVATIAYANAPSLNTFANSTDFTNLFEQWRIVQITWIFSPLYSGTVANPLYTWFDPDDDTIPTGIAEGLQQQTLRISPSGVSVERTTTPQISLGGTATGGVPGYMSLSSRFWCDTDSPTTRYYGIKAAIPANTNIAAGVPLYGVEASCILQFRRPR